MSAPSVVVVLGNRPQFIKHAALARAWQGREHELRPVVVDTGQHYDYALAGVFMHELEIPRPDHSLAVGSASHGEQLARMLSPLEEVLLRERPAMVVVYGDTNSTLAGALAAAKLNIPVAHVEAGLRSFDRTMPEEVNRVVADHVSALLFCPTDAAVENLGREGIVDGREARSVRLVGDVMADVALAIAPAADRRWEALREQLHLPASGTFGVVTAHRAATTEPEALARLLECLRAVDAPLVFPVHPRTQAAFERCGLHVELAELANVTLVPPLGYVDMTATVRNAAVVVTDSGGLQKEAFLHGVPCVTLRDATEWVETVDLGMNVLAGLDATRVAEATARALDGRAARAVGDELPPVYGRGDAATRILDSIVAAVRAGALLAPAGGVAGAGIDVAATATSPATGDAG